MIWGKAHKATSAGVLLCQFRILMEVTAVCFLVELHEPAQNSGQMLVLCGGGAQLHALAAGLDNAQR